MNELGKKIAKKRCRTDTVGICSKAFCDQTDCEQMGVRNGNAGY